MVLAEMTPPSAADKSYDYIGRDFREVATPALILDIKQAEANIDLMALRVREYGRGLRPHAKAHKSPELAKRQMLSGAVGITVATVSEAIAMAEAGLSQILIANQVVGEAKSRGLVRAARHSSVIVAADDEGNLRALSRVATAAAVRIGVLIELDLGMGRAGARSSEEALALARIADELPGIDLRGLQGYEGHCMHEPDPDLRETKIKLAIDKLGDVSAQLGKAGLPCDVVTAGGTGSYAVTGRDARVSDIQPGTYVLMDVFHRGFVTDFPPAVSILTTVVSSHADTFVADFGRKSVATEFCMAEVAASGQRPRYLAEEHALFDCGGDDRPSVGDVLQVIPGYGPSTVSLHRSYYVVRDEVIVDVWPIVGTNPLFA